MIVVSNDNYLLFGSNRSKLVAEICMIVVGVVVVVAVAVAVVAAALEVLGLVAGPMVFVAIPVGDIAGTGAVTAGTRHYDLVDMSHIALRIPPEDSRNMVDSGIQLPIRDTIYKRSLVTSNIWKV